MHLLKRLTPRNWAWINFKISLGVIWAVLMMIFPTRGVLITLDQPLVTVWMSLTIIGVLVSLVGYVMSQSLGKAGVLGVSVELVGLGFFSVGPAVYFIAQLYLAFTESFEGRIALSAFAYATCMVIFYRFVVVIPRFRREAHDESKEA